MTSEPEIQQSLFPEPQELLVARCDAEIRALLLGYAGGPRGLTLDDQEKAVLRRLRYRRGVINAINIRDLEQATGIGPRSLKEIVRNLRMNFRVPIGSSKNAAKGGYFIIVSNDDRAIWINDVLSQIRAEVAVLRAAAGHQAGLELLGQLMIELNEHGTQGAANGTFR